MSYVDDQAESALLFRIEGLVASGTRSLDFREVAGTLAIPEDSARQCLAKLRNLERLSAHVEGGKVLYAVGDRCQAARRINEKPSRPPDSSIPKGVVTEKKRITVEIEKPEPPPLVREEPPQFTPSPVARRGGRDGSTERVLKFIEEIDRPLLGSELVDLTGLPLDKVERLCYYLAHSRGVVDIMHGDGGKFYHRRSKPYPEDRVNAAAPAPDPEVVDAEHAAFLARPRPEEPPMPMPPAQTHAEVYVDTEPTEREFLKGIPRFSKRTVLPLLDKPLVEASINADGEILIIDDGEIVVIPQHQSRAVARLIRRLDQAGLLDG